MFFSHSIITQENFGSSCQNIITIIHQKFFNQHKSIKKVVAFQDWKILLIQYLTIYFILLQILFDVKKGQRTSKVIIFEMSNKSKK